MRILYLDLDTLRPDHLGCYGYHRNTSPNIDRIAAQGVRFDNYYCSDAPCLPSRAALMTGRFGIHTGVVSHGGTCADLRLEGPDRGFRDSLSPSGCLPAMLRQAGLHTVSIGAFAERHSAWWFYAGFREMHNTGKGGMESAEEVTPTVAGLDRAQRRARQLVPARQLLGPAHALPRAGRVRQPVRRRPAARLADAGGAGASTGVTSGRTARARSACTTADSTRAGRASPASCATWPTCAAASTATTAASATWTSTSAGSSRRWSGQGVLDDLAIIVTSDHGENLGELGIYGEHGTADDITCRIPHDRPLAGRRRAAAWTGPALQPRPGAPRWPSCLAAGQARTGTGESFAAASARGPSRGPGVPGAQPVLPRVPAQRALGRLALHAHLPRRLPPLPAARCSSTWPTIRTSSTTWQPPGPTSARRACAI